jgi:hypothetical protein
MLDSLSEELPSPPAQAKTSCQSCNAKLSQGNEKRHWQHYCEFGPRIREPCPFCGSLLVPSYIPDHHRYHCQLGPRDKTAPEVKGPPQAGPEEDVPYALTSASAGAEQDGRGDGTMEVVRRRSRSIAVGVGGRVGEREVEAKTLPEGKPPLEACSDCGHPITLNHLYEHCEYHCPSGPKTRTPCDDCGVLIQPSTSKAHYQFSCPYGLILAFLYIVL